MSEPDVSPEQQRYVDELSTLSGHLLSAIASEAAAQVSKERLQEDPLATDETRFRVASTYREAQASVTTLRENLLNVHLEFLRKQVS